MAVHHQSAIPAVFCARCPSFLPYCQYEQVVSAEALRMVVLLKNTEVVDGGAYVDPIPDAWELEFIDVGQVSNTCRPFCYCNCIRR